MRSITLGLALGLLGGVAMASAAGAQTPPAPPSPPPALKQPAAGPTPAPAAPQPGIPQANAPTPPAAPGQQSAQNGQPAVSAPSGPPEGMIVETPNGFYLVRPGDPNPQHLDFGRGGPGPMRMGQPGPGRPMMGQAGLPDGEDAMGDMAEDGAPPPPPPRRGPPPRPPEAKGAHLHIHTPNLDVNVKCPDDEPIKGCVDAISQLMDKANTQTH